MKQAAKTISCSKFHDEFLVSTSHRTQLDQSVRGDKDKAKQGKTKQEALVAAYQDKEEANKGGQRCGTEKGAPERDKQSRGTQAEERCGAIGNGSLPLRKQGEEEVGGPEAPLGEEGPVAIGENSDSVPGATDRGAGGEEEVLAGLRPHPPLCEQADVLHHHHIIRTFEATSKVYETRQQETERRRAGLDNCVLT